MSSGKGICRDPVPRDIDAARDPYPLMLHRIIEKPLERGSSSGTSGEPAMQPDRHHARPRLALAVEHVEAVLQIREKLVARIEALRRDVRRVEGGEAAGADFDAA